MMQKTGPLRYVPSLSGLRRFSRTAALREKTQYSTNREESRGWEHCSSGHVRKHPHAHSAPHHKNKQSHNKA